MEKGEKHFGKGEKEPRPKKTVDPRPIGRVAINGAKKR